MWKDLTMQEKADIMKLSLANGISSLKTIKEQYNKYAEGGNFNAGNLVNAIYNNTKNEEYLGPPNHGYNFIKPTWWIKQNGFNNVDERGHMDDRVKLESHPTHPSRGTFRSLNQFDFTNKGFEDPNYTMFGVVDNDQDPQATMTYRGGIVLPELTITPKGNYVLNSYDNFKLHL
jgi:hypothetical protein